MCKWWLSACLLLAGFGAFANVAAQPVPYHGWSRITNGATHPILGPDGGMCLDVPRESRVVGTLLQMYACNNKSNQNFRAMDQSHASTRIAIYANAEERCLSYAPFADGFTKVFIDRCDVARRWTIDRAGLRPVDDPNACLALEPAFGFLSVSYCRNSVWNQFGHNWGVSQLLRLGGPRQIRSVGVLNTCVDVKGGSTAPGSSLVHVACGAQPRQWFQMHQVTTLPGNNVLISVYTGGEQLCLSNLLHGKQDATEAVPCDPSQETQLWTTVGPVGAASIQTTLRNVASRRCLEAYNDGGKWVGTRPCSGHANQNWRL